MQNLNIGVVASSGGSAFLNMYKCLTEAGKKHRFFVITDRRCGIEDFCDKEKITLKRINESSNKQFSILAAEFFNFCKVDYVILFFSRLVTKEFFLLFPVFNIHPSLLPSFKGMNAIKMAKNSGVRFLGCTLHLIDTKVDEGTIVAQACMPILSSMSIEHLNKCSYIQKSILAILLVDLLENDKLLIDTKKNYCSLKNGLKENNRCCPFFINKQYAKYIKRIELIEGVSVL